MLLPTSRDETVLGPLLERRATIIPNDIFALFEGGEAWTVAETLRQSYRMARALLELGVQQGDRVLCWCPNSQHSLLTWFGANLIGAVFVPINLAYRGMTLQRILQNARARVGIVHTDLIERLAHLDLGDLKVIVRLGPAGSDPTPEGVTVLDRADLDGADDSAVGPVRRLEPWDLQSVIFTSGTTGLSKGVMSPYLHLATAARAATTFDGESPSSSDRFLVHFPFFHVGGTIPTYAMLMSGGAIAVSSGFATKNFWETVRRSESTLTWLTGSMILFLLNEPSHADERFHPLRQVSVGPVSAESTLFGKRFGVDIVTVYNQTETSAPIVSSRNPTTPLTLGRVRPGVEVRVVDDADFEVPEGATGELVVRCDTPWTMMTGYDNMPEATAKVWRNGWLHTGDAVRRDQDGVYYFVDRLSDCIRRRGENVSSAEVEEELLAYPGVVQAAAVAVPSNHGEDEVMAVVLAQEPDTFDPRALIEFLVDRLPHFMVPRFVRVVREMPMTPTNKIRKAALREDGVTDDTWDRESHGLFVKGTRLRNV